MSVPILLGSFAHQSLHKRDDYLEMATFLSVNGLSAGWECSLHWLINTLACVLNLACSCLSSHTTSRV
ncbi:MAG: hypothetical protein ACTSO9_16690 [Candidatus Helarchaeota archaeon]